MVSLFDMKKSTIHIPVCYFPRPSPMFLRLSRQAQNITENNSSYYIQADTPRRRGITVASRLWLCIFIKRGVPVALRLCIFNQMG